ncbi:hypothetical protein NUU61_007025 [Penicillium alfredii]|uniref:C2H2-type domain-containing protein n=1 Tax=Penicillium alfredii TaxID=1506179 RepID=A0A9W9F299_9EURO|nr:uncharacterized protein NUU61_007025 [Penicillium alfredii]KAJ5092155.1 hypothetical protein NUU61_007025 [Penicillium alfredii]
MSSEVAVAVARPPFEPGANPSAPMAALMQSNNEPVAVSNPLSGAPSISSEHFAFLKSQSKPESLSSIASAGLHVSPSRDQLPRMTSPAPGPADRSAEHDKEAERNSSHVAREALGASEKSPDASMHNAVHASPEQMQIDSHANEPSSDPYGSNDHPNTLLNTTVASPGPIEESTSQDGDQHRPRAGSEIDSDSHKAFSYPPLIGAINDPRRGLSLPSSGYNRGSPRSPSAKKHRCPYCATEFTRQHNLKSHLLTHSQEKPFVCQTCQSRFRRLHDLKRHTKLHTGERPHICPKCGRRFARGDALARHNKGQGGCAGRRASMGSFAPDDEYPDGSTGGPDDTMDGIVCAEPERMDEEDERRFNAPSIRKHDADLLHPSDSLHVRQSNTYPPLSVNRPNHSSLYPPPANHAGSGTSTSTHPGSLTYPPTGFPSSSSLFSNAVSDSPKPLSPNALSSQHNSQPPRAHSPGMSQSLPQPPFGRTGQSSAPNHAAPSLGLPPPQPGAPQLPPPPGLSSPDSRFGLQAAKHTPSHSHSSSHSLPAPKTGAEAPDANGANASQVDKLWVYARSMHEELTGLRAEVAALRAQIASNNNSGAPAPVEVNSANTGPR